MNLIVEGKFIENNVISTPSPHKADAWHTRNLLCDGSPTTICPAFLDVHTLGEPSVLSPKSMEGEVVWRYSFWALCTRQEQVPDGTVPIVSFK